MDSEILLKSLIFMAEGLAGTIGENGARAIIRQSGSRAAANFLEAIPLKVELADAIQRACTVMEELGFAKQVKLIDEKHLSVQFNVVSDTLKAMGQSAERHPAVYYVIGLFEGFVQVISEGRTKVLNHEINDQGEIWILE